MTGQLLRAVTVALAVTVAGCSAADGPGAPRLGEGDRGLLRLAEQTLVHRCMAGRGLRYVVAPAPRPSPPSGPYSSDDVAERRRHGYRRPAPPPEPNDVYARTLPPPQRARYVDTLLGSTDAPTGRVRIVDGSVMHFPLTGCIAVARAELYGDNAAYRQAAVFVENLRGEIERRVLTDPRYGTVLRSWRECMRGAGHPAQDPGAAVELARRRPAAERAIAVADATCSRRTGLTAAGRRLDSEHEREVRAEHPDEVRACARFQSDGLVTARRVVATR